LAKVVYQTCFVLNITPWEENKNILTLLSRERCLFTALHHIRPQKSQLGADLFPNLFQTVQATLNFKEDGRHRLLGFHTSDSSPCQQNLHAYSGLCLLSRTLQKTVHENQEDPMPFQFWKRQMSGPFGDEHWTDILCDLNYTFGTWPSCTHCEQCGTKKEDLQNSGDKLHCSSCGVGIHLSPSLKTFFKRHFLSDQHLALAPEDAKLLRRILWKRLPEALHRDRLFKRLTQVHFHPQVKSQLHS
jgi:recombinational DNA repair protein (RecF pathway)